MLSNKSISTRVPNNQVTPERGPIIIDVPPNSPLDVVHPNGDAHRTTTMQHRWSINETTPLVENIYSEREMLRDLFLWSVFMNLPEMSKVFLAHMKERICASLIAAKIFKTYSEAVGLIDSRDQLQLHATDFEIYSAKCVEKCYAYSESMSCELLLRETPSFGKVNCMQVRLIFN